MVLKVGLFYLVWSMWDYPDIRLLALHRMPAASAMDIPRTIPNDFDLDDCIASGELDFAIGGAIKLKAKISNHVAIQKIKC